VACSTAKPSTNLSPVCLKFLPETTVAMYALPGIKTTSLHRGKSSKLTIMVCCMLQSVSGMPGWHCHLPRLRRMDKLFDMLSMANSLGTLHAAIYSSITEHRCWPDTDFGQVLGQSTCLLNAWQDERYGLVPQTSNLKSTCWLIKDCETIAMKLRSGCLTRLWGLHRFVCLRGHGNFLLVPGPNFPGEPSPTQALTMQ
jgi:hypothetical protein